MVYHFESLRFLFNSFLAAWAGDDDVSLAARHAKDRFAFVTFEINVRFFVPLFVFVELDGVGGFVFDLQVDLQLTSAFGIIF